MSGHSHFAPAPGDLARSVHQEGGALDPHVFSPIHALLDPNAVGLGRLLCLIGQKTDAEVVLIGELAMACRAVGRDADDVGTRLFERLNEAREALSFGRTTRSIVLGIEINDDQPALEPRQPDALAVSIGKLEIGSLRTILYHQSCAFLLSLLPLHVD